MKRAAMFFDIDGTLTNNATGEVIESGIEAIKQARANGHLAFINTGRVRYTIQDWIKELPMDGILLGCGTGILYEDGSFKGKHVSQELCLETSKRLYKHRVSGFMEGSTNVWYVNHEIIDFAVLFVERMYYQNHIGTIANSAEEVGIFDKLCIIIDENSDCTGFIEWAREHYEIIDRKQNFYELVPKGCSKASAIEQIQNEYGIPLEDVYIFGDSTNDLPMFEYAIHTVCMGDHDNELEPYTEYMAPKVEEDGIKKALEHYGLI